MKVLWINTLMFLVIAGAALYGNSTALLFDSLDNLGDAMTYGLSLYVMQLTVASIVSMKHATELLP